MKMRGRKENGSIWLTPIGSLFSTAAASDDTRQRFSKASLLASCGSTPMAPRSTGQAGAWAGLGPTDGSATLAAFVASLDAAASEAPSTYVFDAPLPQLCPELLEGWR